MAENREKNWLFLVISDRILKQVYGKEQSFFKKIIISQGQ